MKPEIAEFEFEQVAALAALMAESRPEYLAHFQPFPFTEVALRERLQHRREDRYWTLHHEGELAGFFMLRGFDEGYARPSFGIFVAEKYAGRHLATAALQHAIAWCREHHLPRVMLKVHPENVAAIAVYNRAGFHFTEVCPRTQHHVFELQLQGESTLDPTRPGGEISR